VSSGGGSGLALDFEDGGTAADVPGSAGAAMTVRLLESP